MNAKNIWTAFARSPTSMKLLVIMVILIWLIPFVMIIMSLIFFLERSGAALEATPRAAMPTLKFRVDHFDPDTGEFSHSEYLPSLWGQELFNYIRIEQANFGCEPGEHLCCNGPTQELSWPKDEENLFVEFAVRESETDEFVTGPSCRLEHAADEHRHTTGQYQGFIGPVPFGTYTPYLEPGKEYFDMTQSIMAQCGVPSWQPG
jgi:hypothetical protein